MIKVETEKWQHRVHTARRNGIARKRKEQSGKVYKTELVVYTYKMSI